MSAESVILAALTHEPASTSDLYERVGYAALVRVGRVRYKDFHAELTRLSASGLAARAEDRHGATMWRLPGPPGEL